MHAMVFCATESPHWSYTRLCSPQACNNNNNNKENLLNQVRREPIVKEFSGIDEGTLVADLCVCGVSQPQCDALFDIRVVDTDAPSYSRQSPRSVLCSAESEKKKKYLQVCHDRKADFTPLCVSIDGMLGAEAEFFLKCLGDFLAVKWERPFSVVMGWI